MTRGRHQAAACWPAMPLLDGLGKPGSGVSRPFSTRPKAKHSTSGWTPVGPRDKTWQPWSSWLAVPF